MNARNQERYWTSLLSSKRRDTLDYKRSRHPLNKGKKSVMGISVQHKNVDVNPIVIVGIILPDYCTCSKAIPQPGIRAKKTPVRKTCLKKIRPRKSIAWKRSEFFEILPIHANICIVIPWNESVMTDRAKKCTCECNSLYVVFPANLKEL